MKRGRLVSINFARTDYRLIFRAAIGLGLSACGLAVVALLLIVSGVSDMSRGRDMDKRLSELSSHEEKINAIIKEKEQLIRELNSMSALVSAREFSWTKMLTGIESVVPTGVAIKSVKYNPKDRSLSLEGTAGSPEALRNLVAMMEKSRFFREPFLRRQSIEKGRISFDVVAVYVD